MQAVTSSIGTTSYSGLPIVVYPVALFSKAIDGWDSDIFGTNAGH